MPRLPTPIGPVVPSKRFPYRDPPHPAGPLAHYREVMAKLGLKVGR
jgi:hypothetical protein